MNIKSPLMKECHFRYMISIICSALNIKFLMKLLHFFFSFQLHTQKKAMQAPLPFVSLWLNSPWTMVTAAAAAADVQTAAAAAAPLSFPFAVPQTPFSLSILSAVFTFLLPLSPPS